MIAFNTDISSSSANSYISVSSASDLIYTYASKSEGDTWVALSADVQQSLLIRSAAVIDNAYTWLGSKTVAIQGLDWARDNVPIEGIYATCNNSNTLLPNNEIPLAVQIAAAITSIELNSVNRETAQPFTAVKSTQVGELSVTFRDTNEVFGDMYQISNRVNEYLKKYGSLTSSLNTSGSSFKIYQGVR